MARTYHIIDGYNLLHACGWMQEKFGPGGLERSRMKLLRFVANRLAPGERLDATIVFDAPEQRLPGPRETQFEEMSVLFSDAGSDADSLIEELVARHSSPRQILVVSSDHRVQRAALRRRGRAVDSERFLRILESRESAFPGTDRETQSLAAGPEPDPSREVLSRDEDWLAHIDGVIQDLESGRLDPPSRRHDIAGPPDGVPASDCVGDTAGGSGSEFRVASVSTGPSPLNSALPTTSAVPDSSVRPHATRRRRKSDAAAAHPDDGKQQPVSLADDPEWKARVARLIDELAAQQESD